MKAILVIDLPKDCKSCLCNDYEEGYCKAFGDGRTNVCDWNSDVIPRWCPLRPLPQKREPKEEWLNEYHRDEFADGWNACLEEITDESNICD